MPLAWLATSTPPSRRRRPARALTAARRAAARARRCCAGSPTWSPSTAGGRPRPRPPTTASCSREMARPARGLPDDYDYFAGGADKLHGERHPRRPGELPRLHAARAGRRRRGDHALELAAAAAHAGSWRRRWRRATRSWSSRAEHTPARTLESAASWSSEAGFPPGVVNVVTGVRRGGRRARWSRIRASTRSPSPARRRPVGGVIARAAADNLTRVTLELGGKSPNIVFADADLDARPTASSAGIFAATGQTCMAGSRLLVHDAVYDELRRAGRRARRRRSASAIRWTPRPRWGRWRPRSSCETVLSDVAVGAAEQARGWSPAAARRSTAPAAGSSSRRSSATSTTPCGAAREEIFGPVRGGHALRRRGRGDRDRQRHRVRPRRGRLDRATCSAPTGWRARCAPARCGSTPTARSARTVPFGGFKGQRHRARERHRWRSRGRSPCCDATGPWRSPCL